MSDYTSPRPNFLNLAGKVFGRWTVVSYAGDGRWFCRCECGTRKAILSQALRRGLSASCGCAPRVKVIRDILDENVTKSAEGCWEWQGRRPGGRYGCFMHNYKNVPAHRAAYREWVGPIPDGLCVLHRCDNPPCVRPDHLFLGTNADNIRDKVAKGRQARGQKVVCAPEKKPRGEKVVNSVLTEDMIRDAHVRVTAGQSVRSVAHGYAVSSSALWSALKGKSWAHLNLTPIRP